MLSQALVLDGTATGTEREHITYWEVIYCTTHSAALKQKAADILKGNGIPLPEKKG